MFRLGSREWIHSSGVTRSGCFEEIEQEDQRGKRGRLNVFLGYASGVGKSARMRAKEWAAAAGRGRRHRRATRFEGAADILISPIRLLSPARSGCLSLRLFVAAV